MPAQPTGPLGHVVVIRPDYTYFSCANVEGEHTVDERVLLWGRDDTDQPYRVFDAHEWREVWIYSGTGAVAQHEFNSEFLKPPVSSLRLVP
jgi:hypothetical protein